MRLSVFFAHTLPYPLLRDDPFLVGCLLLLLDLLLVACLPKTTMSQSSLGSFSLNNDTTY